MIKTLKTIFAIAVSFSIVTISNSFADGHMVQLRNGLTVSLVFLLFLLKKERKN